MARMDNEKSQEGKAESPSTLFSSYCGIFPRSMVTAPSPYQLTERFDYTALILACQRLDIQGDFSL